MMSTAPVPFPQAAPPELAQLLLDSLPAAVAIFQVEDPADPLSLRYIYANGPTRTVTGMDPATTVGRLFRDMNLAPGVLERLQIYADVAMTGVQRDLGEIFRPADALAKEGWYAIRLVPLPNLCCGLLALNITERRAAEHKIKEQEQFLEVILENLPNMVFVKDAKDLSFVRFNKAGEHLLGYPREALIGKSDLDFFPAEQAAFFIEKDREVLRSGQLFDIEEELIQTASGERWLHTQKVPVLDKNGNPEYLLGISEDITERRERDAQLRALQRLAEEASRAKSSFMARVSHEIRTPMNAILGLTELVLDSQLTAEQREQLQAVHSASAALRALLNDILDFERTLAGHSELRPVAIDLRAHLADCVQTFRALATAKKLTLSTDVAADVPANVLLDPLRVRQVVANLVGNALKFTDTGSVRLMVSLHSHGPSEPMLHYAVHDTGIGIADKDRQLVFEMFRQVDESTTRAYAGTGLGLTIVRQLVEIMGGSVGFDSTLGQGSRFWFTLPCRLPPQLVGAHHAAAAHAVTPRRTLHVLVVEDNAVNEKLMTRVLNQAGHVVTVARNGMEAVSLAGLQRFDVVLMDMQMPLLDGYEATTQIRAHEAAAGWRVPIVALTAHAMAGDRDKCLALGADEYVAKPIDRQELFAALARVVR